MSIARTVRVLGLAALAAGVSASAALALGPNHPVLTEVYRDPPGVNDGPVGRLPGNAHQEYIEIYLPPLSALAPTLNKDAIQLTFYEVEGDSSSTGLGLVEYRIDLPSFDLDPSNGLTGLPRPASGVVVLGWVDYTGTPPTALAGTPATRVGLVNGGITSAVGFTFIAVNGAQFGGTTNFPVPAAVSGIDLTSLDPTEGFMDNGSAVFLLMNRAAAGYVQRFAVDDPAHQPPNPNAVVSLPTGTVLGVASLLDGVAGNDDSNFDVLKQPYQPPTGKNIDLETVLPKNGAFSLRAAQVYEAHENGYARLLVDIAKTTEDANAGNDDPVADALFAYRTIANTGPLRATPGRAPFSTSAPELAVGDAGLQFFDVLSDTTGRPGLVAANAGGDFAMQVTATPGASSAPALMTFAPGDASVTPLGQSPVYPSVAATVAAGAAPGSLVTAPVTLHAVTLAGPPTVNPNASVTATFRVLDPTTGLTAGGLPFQATSLVAVQGIQPGAAANELLGTSFGAFVTAGLAGGLVKEALGNATALTNPATNLASPIVVDTLDVEMPALPALFIQVPSPAGLESLVTTVLTSAEVAAGTGTYDASLNATSTAVAAIEIPIAETRTSGGLFVPSERVHYADAAGLPGAPTSGLSNVDTNRGFELALVDSQVQSAGTLESGATDDFGLIVEIGQTEPGAAVVPGQFVFLSMMGGLEGADVDSLDVPPHGTQDNIVYVDLEPFHAVLGAKTVNRLFVVDGSGTGAVDLIGAFSLNALPCSNGIDDDGDGATDFPLDGGCTSVDDRSELPDCSDGLDNDGDGAIDAGSDVGCLDAAKPRENPQCQDGIGNDADGLIDWDGGASAGVPLAQQTQPDPQCVGKPYLDREAPASSCGLGAGLVAVIPLLSALRRRSIRR